MQDSDSKNKTKDNGSYLCKPSKQQFTDEEILCVFFLKQGYTRVALAGLELT